MEFEHLEEKEAVERAALIKKNGRAFYTLLSVKSSDPETADVLKRLAKEEERHLKLLEEKFFPEAGFPEEITDEEIEIERYIERRCVSELFVKKIDVEKLVSLMDSVKKALLVALEVELHAAEYFEKLGRMATTEDGRRLYGELAEEERAHAGEIERLLG